MTNIAGLVFRLQEPRITMFDQHEHRAAIAKLGRDAVLVLLPMIPSDPQLIEGLLRQTLKTISSGSDLDRARNDLEPKLDPSHDLTTRQVCGRLLVGQFPEAIHIGLRLLDFAADRRTLGKGVLSSE